MGKAAAKVKTTTPATDGQQYMDVFAARSRFLVVTLNMGWRLALTVLIPLIAGIKLDDRFHSSPSYTLAGLFLAIGGGAAVVWSTVKDVNAETAAEEAEEAKLKTKGTKV